MAHQMKKEPSLYDMKIQPKNRVCYVLPFRPGKNVQVCPPRPACRSKTVLGMAGGFQDYGAFEGLELTHCF